MIPGTVSRLASPLRGTDAQRIAAPGPLRSAERLRTPPVWRTGGRKGQSAGGVDGCGSSALGDSLLLRRLSGLSVRLR